jgi:Mn-containing catalase
LATVWGTEEELTSDPDPVGASAVQELLGGKYGEMSTFMNYTYQSFNFRSRQGARPFYDLVASIAAEEFGHIELVSAAINTMLTGATDGEPGELGDLTGVKGVRNTQHFIAVVRGRWCRTRWASRGTAITCSPRGI